MLFSFRIYLKKFLKIVIFILCEKIIYNIKLNLILQNYYFFKGIIFKLLLVNLVILLEKRFVFNHLNLIKNLILKRFKYYLIII